MKVHYKYHIQGYQGSCDSLIYYYDKILGQSLARRKFTFKDHPAHPGFRQNQRAIFALNPCEAYRRDLTHYVYLHDADPKNRAHPLRAWPNAYCRLMYALKRDYGCDLSGLSRAQILEQDLPCRSVKAAIEAGLLESVRGYKQLNAAMFTVPEEG